MVDNILLHFTNLIPQSPSNSPSIVLALCEGATPISHGFDRGMRGTSLSLSDLLK
jgi:hypothetical protein